MNESRDAASTDPQKPAQLTLTRSSDDDARQRQVYVSLDDQQIAYMMFGDSVTKPIPPGRHRLKANNTLVWKSLDFEAQPGEHITFSVVNYSGRGFALLLTLFGVSLLFLRIDRVGGQQSQTVSHA